MCTGEEFQEGGAEAEQARHEELLVMPDGLARFVLEERNDLDGS